MKKLVSIFVVTIMCMTLFACESNTAPDLWESATYTEDTELGSGEKTIEVEVIAQEKTVKFKINTDKETLGEALLEHKLIAGEKQAYGLYIKSVNGMIADYNVDKTYWSISKNGEYMMTGVDGEKISGGEKYELTHTK